MLQMLALLVPWSTARKRVYINHAARKIVAHILTALLVYWCQELDREKVRLITESMVSINWSP